MSDLNPTVWADGYGRWHASVPLTDSPLRDALAARRAILAELQARAPIGAKISFHVTRERVTNHGTAIYGEK
jgi:hypothetical protein